MPFRFYIETYGCQMNKYDSELIAGLLLTGTYELAKTLDEADIILVNTCAVREHAERRVLGRISELNKYKLIKPKLILGVIGCMAQRLGEKLQNIRYIDLVVGPDNYRNMIKIIENLRFKRRRKQNHSILNNKEIYEGIIPYRYSKVHAWIAIMRGCNNFCTYCIVPYVRGRERSRSVDDILNELHNTAKQGFREISLVGQNVNSYHYGDVNFAKLLELVCQVEGIERVLFVTSHPKDMSDDVIKIMAQESKICETLHLPFQSGSNNVLKAMNRGYTREYYLNLIDNIRKHIPDIALTSDVMVGFPGETDTDFEDTLSLLEIVRFDSIFNFKYSPREGTKAIDFEDQIPDEIKQARLERLINLQQKISKEINAKLVGQTLEILINGKGKYPNQIIGYTRHNKAVICEGAEDLIGQFAIVKIISTSGYTFKGEIRD